jgi:hypothetical protein
LADCSCRTHISVNVIFTISGVYQLSCSTCKMKYIGQTGRCFHIRYKEHILDYTQGNMKSNFAKHLIEQRHTRGTIEDTMDVVHTTSKGRLLNVIEKFYIYCETKINNQINDCNTVTPNIIFDTLLRMNGWTDLTQQQPCYTFTSVSPFPTDALHIPHSRCLHCKYCPTYIHKTLYHGSITTIPYFCQ